MGLFDRLRRGMTGGSGNATIHIGDPFYDEWEVVRDYGDLPIAQAFQSALHEAEITAVITADWKLDRFGRGDIALRVPPGSWSDAEELLSNLD